MADTGWWLVHAADRKASKSKEKAADKLQQSRRQVLVEFYKKHVPEKTASDVDAIIAKRQSKGKNWFDELCAKLKAKYGEDPADGLATGSGAAEEAASSSSSSRSSNDDADSESSAPPSIRSPRLLRAGLVIALLLLAAGPRPCAGRVRFFAEVRR